MVKDWMNRFAGARQIAIALTISTALGCGLYGLYAWLHTFDNSRDSATQWPGDHPSLNDLIQIPNNRLSSRDRLNLISALQSEVTAAGTRSPNARPSDGHGEELIELALKVSSLGDNRAVLALTNVLDVSTSVDEAVAEFGTVAIAPVIQQLSNPLVRSDATETLGLILKAHKLHKAALNANSLGKVQEQLMVLTYDSEWRTRRLAVRGLGYGVTSDRILRRLQQISRSDPYAKQSLASDRGKITYPVRQEAIDALTKLSE